MEDEIVEVPADYTGAETPVNSTTVATESQAVTPPPIIAAPDFEALRAQAIEEGRRLAREELLASQQVAQTPAPVATPKSELPPEFFEDPEGYMDRKAAAQAKLAVEQAMATVMPYIQRTQSDDVVGKVAKGLTPDAQDFARKIASQIAPGVKLEGEALDLIQRATRDYDREVREKQAKTVEPAVAETATVRMNSDMMDTFKANNAFRAKHNLPPMSAAEFKAQMEKQ